MRILLILLITLSFSACAGIQHYQSPQQQSLSDEHFKVATTVRTDAHDALVAFTTRPGFEQKQGPMARVKVDTFLRAYIDKRTRTRIFEVHQLIKYTDKKRRDYKTVEYQTARGPKSVGLTRLRSDAECVLTSGKECNYHEHIGFRVSGRLLSEIASSYDRDKGKAPSWSLKFVPLSGQDFQTRIMAAEIKGLLDKMREYEQAMM